MEHEDDLPGLTLHPGDLYLARSPAQLETILGSCVGVTFWSARIGAGALCHCLLPKWRDKYSGGASLAIKQRYLDFTIRYLASQFDVLGANRNEVEVKVFGGADVLPVLAHRTAILTVGALNCQMALEVLEEEGFKVTASDLRGVRGRRIYFHTGTGEVMVRRLNSWPASRGDEFRCFDGDTISSSGKAIREKGLPNTPLFQNGM